MTDCKNEQLLDAAITLLRENEGAEGITTRMIAERAGVNLALINYYYGSKDNLLKAAVGEIMGKSSADLYGFASDCDPLETIVGFFTAISHDMLRYRRYSSLFLPDLILKDKIELPDLILPAVRRAMPSASEQDCRMTAYRMVVQCQIIFLRLDDVGRYVGKDLADESVLESMIRDIVEGTIGREPHER